MNTEECLICKAPLEYLVQDEMMECAVCHKKEPSKTRCVNGHYVCSDCHTQGMDSIFGLCLSETSTDPVAIVRRMMELPFCHMHGPEHHVMVGAALLTAYKNAGGSLDLEEALREMYSRGMAVPGGACGFWGACGAGISAGQFLAIATASTPLAREPWGLSNQMTARVLDSIGRAGGPVLQAGFLPGHSRRCGFCPGASGGGDGADGSCLHLQQPEQPVHRQALSLLGGKSQKAQGGVSLRPQLLPQSDGGGPGQEAGRRCV